MPDTRANRGPHPKDAACFSPEALPGVRSAVADLSWLLSRGYSRKAALKLVGDRHGLRDRQRMAVQRCAASSEDCETRRRTRVEARALDGATLLLDGYNVLLTLEAALSGGVLLLGRDGTLRDLTAMRSHYRRMQSTVPALELVARFCSDKGCRKLEWALDRPISNSGRLKALMETRARAGGWPWEVALLADPDRALAESPHIVATADSGILDTCRRWYNLTREVIDERVPDAWILDFELPMGNGDP